MRFSLDAKKNKFITINLKDFYLNTPLKKYKYMWAPENMIPNEIIQEYNLRPLINNGCTLAEIRKTMYGLPHAGRISYTTPSSRTSFKEDTFHHATPQVPSDTTQNPSHSASS